MWIGISIIAVCIFFMVFFHKNIRALMDRIKGIKYGSTELQTESPSQEPVDTTASSTEKLMKALNNPIIQEAEDFINETLTKADVKEGPEREKLLIRYLAASHLALALERINSAIWGSQIYILEHLNVSRLGVSKEEIKTTYYDDAVKKWPPTFANYSYDAYLGFLKNSNLILEGNGNLLITKLGVEFLQYLARIGKSGARFRPG